jgi:predicted transcriptional regulator
MLKPARKVPMAKTDTNSIFDLPLDDAEEARLDAAAENEIEAGHGVPHDRVREWLLKLAKGDKVPPPTA